MDQLSEDLKRLHVPIETINSDGRWDHEFDFGPPTPFSGGKVVDPRPTPRWWHRFSRRRS